MHVFLFDIDGTLVDTGGAGRAALESALTSEFGVKQPASVPLHGRTDRGIAADYFRSHAIAATEENWQRFRAAYLRWLPEHLRTRGGRVLPGVVELVRALEQREDVSVGLLTGNTRAGAELKLAHFGLAEQFAYGGFGDVHQERDLVAADALAATRAHLDRAIEAQRVYVIGDTPFDIRCARAIGARAVAVATGTHDRPDLASHSPDILLDDLAQSEALLELLGN